MNAPARKPNRNCDARKNLWPAKAMTSPVKMAVAQTSLLGVRAGSGQWPVWDNAVMFTAPQKIGSRP